MESALEVETRLSERPALEPNDTSAITSQQQDELDRHKVRVSHVGVAKPAPPTLDVVIIIWSRS